MKLSSPPLLLFTHAAALLGGCLLYSHLRPQTGSTTGGDLQAPAGVTNSAAARTPEQILKDATPALSAKEAAAARRAKDLAAASEAIRTLQIPADLAAALDAETAGWISATAEDPFHFSPRFSALLYHWLLTDPEACGKWFRSSVANRKAAYSHLEAAFPELLKQPESIGILTSENSPATATSLGLWLGYEPDLALIDRFQSQLKPEQQEGFYRLLGSHWPESRRQELIDLALARNKPQMLTFPGIPLGDHRWLADLSRDSSIPADFRHALTRAPFFNSDIAGDPSIPLTDRLSAYGGPSDAAYRSVASRTLSQISREGEPDWPGMVQAGEASPQQALDAIARAAPELADAAPDVLSEKVFHKLLAADAPQAIDLLNDLPAGQRAQVILESVSLTSSPGIYSPSPDTFARIMAQLPADDPSLWDRRRDAWQQELSRNFSHSSEETAAAWIEALPPGPDREIALAYGAEKFQATHPELANRLRNQVTDPRLTQPNNTEK